MVRAQTPEFRTVFAQQPARQHADFHFYEVAGVYEPGGAGAIEFSRRFQTYLLSRQFDRLLEVVDVEGLHGELRRADRLDDGLAGCARRLPAQCPGGYERSGG